MWSWDSSERYFYRESHKWNDQSYWRHDYPSPVRLLRKKVRDLLTFGKFMLRLTSIIVVRRQPTSVSVASLSDSQAKKTSELFHQPWFRWWDLSFALCSNCSEYACSYTGSDPIGIELAGALKNVYAIAAGLADGLGFENNTRASECLVWTSKRPLYWSMN